MNATAPQIPEAALTFAKEAAKLAEQYRIECFEMKFRPDYGDDFSRFGNRGEIVVRMHTKDGRGRPALNVHVSMTAEVIEVIEYTPESIS